MYACLFGEYPVSATKDHVTMASKVLNHTFHIPSIGLENKAQVKEVLFRLLDKNPNQRLCSLEELRQTVFMSPMDFNRIYAKHYSPLAILMNSKSEWRDEIQAQYYRRARETNNDDASVQVNGKNDHYQNVNHHRFQKFSE